MSKKFLSPINVAQGNTFPSVATTGDLFYRTDFGAMYVYDGISWISNTASEFTNVDGGNAGSTYNINYDGGGPSTF